jgi:CyaY protein
MTETEFIHRADSVLFDVGEALDASELDCDWEITDGILSIVLEKGQVILNRHVPNREVWLASAATGAAHFRFDGAVWRDTRGGDALREALSKAVSALSGVAFAAPPM